MYIVKYSELVHMARMHELASASPPYKRVQHILQYKFNNHFIIHPLTSYFTIDNASIYNIQDRPAFHFAVVNLKQLFLAP